MNLLLFVFFFLFGSVTSLVLVLAFVQPRYAARVKREAIWNYLRLTPSWKQEINRENTNIIRTLSVTEVLMLRNYGNAIVVDIEGSPHDPWITVQLGMRHGGKCRAFKASQLIDEITSRVPITSEEGLAVWTDIIPPAPQQMN